MQTENVKIGISSPTEQHLLKVVERYPKTAKVEYPLPEAVAREKTYMLEESFNECCDRLNKHYGTN